MEKYLGGRMSEIVVLDGDLAVADVAAVERVAFRSWPGLEQQVLGGWCLRFAHGITQRANSVWPNDGGIDVELVDVMQAVDAVEAYYHGRGLPARFQICPAAQPLGLDGLLAGRGYGSVGRTAVQHVALAELLSLAQGRPGLVVELSPQPSAAWWACYAAADKVEARSVAVRQTICGGIQIPARYATVLYGDQVIAVGSAAVADGWIGFFNIATLPDYRRMGAATQLMVCLGEWGQSVGASKAYLQVMANNEVALQVYARLGFTTGYFYHYREEVWSG